MSQPYITTFEFSVGANKHRLKIYVTLDGKGERYSVHCVCVHLKLQSFNYS